MYRFRRSTRSPKFGGIKLIPRVNRALLRVFFVANFQQHARLEVSPNLRHAGVFQTSTMVNLGIVFQEHLTRPDIKLDENMSICPSTPQDHRAYTNSNQSSIGFDYFFFFCGESSIVVDYRT